MFNNPSTIIIVPAFYALRDKLFGLFLDTCGFQVMYFSISLVCAQCAKAHSKSPASIGRTSSLIVQSLSLFENMVQVI